MDTETVAQKKRGFGFWVLVVLAVLIVIGLVGSMNDEPADDASGAAAENSTADTEEASAPEENAPGMSAAEFAALQTGMSYDEAVRIIGSPGELMSENEIAGTHTAMYQWDGEGSFGANANAMFQNGELIQKSQFGLE